MSKKSYRGREQCIRDKVKEYVGNFKTPIKCQEEIKTQGIAQKVGGVSAEV